MFSPKYIDAHCHLSFLDKKELKKVLKDSDTLYIQGGYGVQDLLSQINIQKNYPGLIQLAGGIHPWLFNEKTEKEIQSEWINIQDLMISNLCFVGETGFDPCVEQPKEYQNVWFKKHLSFAKEYNRPIVCHVTGYHDLALKSLNQFGGPFRGILHGYTGPPELALEYIKRGLYISLGPNLLKSQFKKIQSTIQTLELRNFVIESDQPKTVGEPFDQSLLGALAERIGVIKGVSKEEVLQISHKNLVELLL